LPVTEIALSSIFATGYHADYKDQKSRSRDQQSEVASDLIAQMGKQLKPP